MNGPEIAIALRPEAAGDETVIRALTTAAFQPMPYSNGSEPDLVDRLREDRDLTLSLVAEDADRIVGHIAISPVTITGGAQGWFGLGPVSVWPEIQQRGIGSALIKRAIADMRVAGAKGIVLLGSTEYYPRFGFVHGPQLTYAGAPAENFQVLLLDGEMPSGEVTYASAFG